MLVLVISIGFIALASGALPNQDATLLPPVTIGACSHTCPTDDAIAQAKNDTRAVINSILRDTVVPGLGACSSSTNQPPCACGGSGQWTRIAFLNMSDPAQRCPTYWNLTTAPVRGCGRSSAAAHTCDSAAFSSNGRYYSRVCGRINAYQRGSPDAFDPSIRGWGSNPNPGLEDAYIDGVSLTHGTAGSREHIWSFAAALYENDPGIATRPYFVCSCTNTNINWPYQVPSFVGANYFCATGNRGPGFVHATLYADDPLWDGEGCGPTNTCCQMNNPPWFCTALPQPTNDDIEVRVCHDQLFADEDIVISLVDIHVM